MPKTSTLARVGFAVTLFVVIAMGVYGTWFGNRRRADAPLDSLRKELKASNAPLTLAELGALRPRIAVNSNGAIVIEALADELSRQALAVEDDVWIPRFHKDLKHYDCFCGIPSIGIEDIKRYVRQHDNTLSALAKLSEYDDGVLTIFDYQKRYDNPLEVLLPATNIWTHAAYLEQLACIVSALESDPESALSAVEIQLIAATTISHEYIMTFTLVADRVLKSAIASMEISLRSFQYDTATLQSLRDRLSKLDPVSGIRRSLYAERVFFLQLCDGLANGTIGVPEVCSNIPSYEKIRADQVKVTRIFNDLIAVCEDPLEVMELGEELGLTIGHLCPEALMASAEPMCIKHSEIEAYVRCADMALAAELFRIETGDWPTSLEALFPEFFDEVPQDPFTDDTVRYKKTEYGVVVYSFGENRKDDGGDFSVPRGKYHPRDIGFRLVNAEERRLPVLDNPR